MKKNLFAIAALAVMSFASCSVGAGISVGDASDKAPNDKIKAAAVSNNNEKDSLSAPVNPEPVK